MKVKKAILTGGGRATRLFPITRTINKHLLPLANKPMIFHAIEKVVEAGIEEIFINTNPGDTSLEQHIGDGGHWGVKIQYFEQTGGPQGIAHVVNEARRFIGSDPFLFYLSDNIILGSIKGLVDEFSVGNYDCMLAFAKVPDPQRFGVPVFNQSGELVEVIEKPKDPPNNFAQTGLFLYGPDVFFDAFARIERSARGEYEISTIHTLFLKEKKRVGYKEITGWWKDTGMRNDLLLANQSLLDHMEDAQFVVSGSVETTAHIEGKVHIGAGSKVGAGTKIIGPVIIGENCFIEQSDIGPHVTIGTGSEIVNTTLRNTMVLENTQILASMQIADSLIGKNVKILPKKQTDQMLMIGDETVLEL